MSKYVKSRITEVDKKDTPHIHILSIDVPDSKVSTADIYNMLNSEVKTRTIPDVPKGTHSVDVELTELVNSWHDKTGVQTTSIFEDLPELYNRKEHPMARRILKWLIGGLHEGAIHEDLNGKVSGVINFGVMLNTVDDDNDTGLYVCVV